MDENKMKLIFFCRSEEQRENLFSWYKFTIAENVILIVCLLYVK